MTATASILRPTHYLAPHRRESFARRAQLSRSTLPAYFSGIQEGIAHIPDVELWTLTEPVGIYPVGSTLSRQTIESHGYVLPRALTLGRDAA